MEEKLQELFRSYVSNPDYMTMKEFENFIINTKICNKNHSQVIFVRFSVNKKLSFGYFINALRDIFLNNKITYEKLIEKILKKVEEEEELKKIEEKKKEIVKRQENNMKINKNIKQEEKIKEILEDMNSMGNFMKNEIIKEKKEHPEKFIPIEEAIKSDDKDNKINFCLGVLAQNLENIGITTVIEKETNNSEESIKASEMIMQFIMNGFIDKKKYALFFEFGEKRNT